MASIHTNLGNALRNSYTDFHDVQELEEAITHYRSALDLNKGDIATNSANYYHRKLPPLSVKARLHWMQSGRSFLKQQSPISPAMDTLILKNHWTLSYGWPTIQVADIGCGTGRSSIALIRVKTKYSEGTVEGVSSCFRLFPRLQWKVMSFRSYKRIRK